MKAVQQEMKQDKKKGHLVPNNDVYKKLKISILGKDKHDKTEDKDEFETEHNQQNCFINSRDRS